jgi:hypothetical protein
LSWKRLSWKRHLQQNKLLLLLKNRLEEVILEDIIREEVVLEKVKYPGSTVTKTLVMLGVQYVVSYF